MGGSEHSQNELAHKNNDMNADDQSKQGPETEIGTDNPNIIPGNLGLSGADKQGCYLLLQILHTKIAYSTQELSMKFPIQIQDHQVQR
jgi:hypothetical protein